jgi:uncharacterized protein YhaN
MSSTDVTKPEKPGKPGKEPERETAQEVARPMGPARLQQMEAGLRAYHETADEMEQLRTQLTDARQDLKARDMEIASLNERMTTLRDDHSQIATAYESRLATVQAERDNAVSEATALKTIISSLKRVLQMEPSR